MAGIAAASGAVAQPATELDFTVRLDGKPIGSHRFVVTRDAAGNAAVSSDAKFEVKVLGWTAYRYEHHARERWSGNCLLQLDASTDDDGKTTTVQRRRGDGIDGCVMTFAYWNAALPDQRRLLDPGTGKLVDVDIAPLQPSPVESRAGTVTAKGWRISGLPNAIDIWWSDGEWIALDTSIGGRRLSYRLR